MPAPVGERAAVARKHRTERRGMIARFIVVTVLVTVGFQPLNAAVFRGSGSTSCGSWTEAKGTGRYDRGSWVMGFLSGYNAYATTGDAELIKMSLSGAKRAGRTFNLKTPLRRTPERADDAIATIAG